MNFLSTKQISLHYGVHPQTIRHWERAGKITTHHRTLGNHRRFCLPSTEGKTVGYVRVSSQDQKNDLAVQTDALKIKAQALGTIVDETIHDMGSGMNYKKRGFRVLLAMILAGKVKKLVIMHRDRLLRFGAEIIFAVCAHLKVEVQILEPSLAKGATEPLCLDLVEIMTVFTNKIYGMRSRSNLRTLSKTA